MPGTVPKLGRVLETALYVDDLDRAAAFYEQVLGLAAISKDSRFRAYDVDGTSVLLLFKRGAIKSPRQRAPGSSLTAADRTELEALMARLERRLAAAGLGRKAAAE